MRAVIQRVSEAEVGVDGECVGKIGKGLLVLLASQVGDEQADIDYIAEKTVNLRIFEDEQGKMNLSAAEVGGELLIVSQFTLMGDARKGRRPGFSQAGSPAEARGIFERAVEAFKKHGLRVEQGRFQAYMQVSLINDGPVTLLLDSRRLF